MAIHYAKRDGDLERCHASLWGEVKMNEVHYNSLRHIGQICSL